MAFDFSLEPVLRLKRGQERLERRKLEAIHSEQAQVLANLDEIVESHLESRRRVQRELALTMTGSELQFHAKRDEGATNFRLALRTRLAEIEQRRLTQMQVYRKIRQSRETLENLRNRKLEIYRVEQARREQQVLDDLFLMRQSISVEENPPKDPSKDPPKE